MARSRKNGCRFGDVGLGDDVGRQLTEGQFSMAQPPFRRLQRFQIFQHGLSLFGRQLVAECMSLVASPGL